MRASRSTTGLPPVSPELSRRPGTGGARLAGGRVQRGALRPRSSAGPGTRRGLVQNAPQPASGSRLYAPRGSKQHNTNSQALAAHFGTAPAASPLGRSASTPSFVQQQLARRPNTASAAADHHHTAAAAAHEGQDVMFFDSPTRSPDPYAAQAALAVEAVAAASAILHNERSSGRPSTSGGLPARAPVENPRPSTANSTAHNPGGSPPPPHWSGGVLLTDGGDDPAQTDAWGNAAPGHVTGRDQAALRDEVKRLQLALVDKFRGKHKSIGGSQFRAPTREVDRPGTAASTADGACRAPDADFTNPRSPSPPSPLPQPPPSAPASRRPRPRYIGCGTRWTRRRRRWWARPPRAARPRRGWAG